MNKDLYQAFDANQGVEAILGLNGYFMASVTYKDKHDDITVISEMIEWAINTNNLVKLDDYLIQSMDYLVENNDTNNMLGTALSYAIVIVDDKKSAYRPNIIDSIKKNISKHQDVIQLDSAAKILIDVIKKRLLEVIV